MKITILTLFPEMFKGPFDTSIIKRAADLKLVEIRYINIRDFGIGRHKMVDDRPFGGGKGMILRVDVLLKAIESTRLQSPGSEATGGQAKGKQNKYKERIILLDPQGKAFDQKMARELSKFSHLILVCGHYEGVDTRIGNFVDEKISVGDFIVTGGEIPAMLIVDSVTRLLKGALKKGVVETESFSPHLEYPQYTKPQTFKDLSVPKVLLSGNHKKIKEWREEESQKITLKFRPDLLKKAR